MERWSRGLNSRIDSISSPKYSSRTGCSRVGGENVDDATAHAELAQRLDQRMTPVAGGGQGLDKLLEREFLTGDDPQRAADEALARLHPLEPGEQRGQNHVDLARGAAVEGLDALADVVGMRGEGAVGIDAEGRKGDDAAVALGVRLKGSQVEQHRLPVDAARQHHRQGSPDLFLQARQHRGPVAARDPLENDRVAVGERAHRFPHGGMSRNDVGDGSEHDPVGR